MLKVHATAWESDSTSASTPSFAISARMRVSLSASDSPANFAPWIVTGPSGWCGTIRPDAVDRIALNGDKFGAGFRASCGEAFGGRRRVQPWIESETVAGAEMLRQPAFRGRIDQRSDAPGLGIHLFRRLQCIAAIDEHRGFLREHDGEAGRSGEVR